MAGGRPRNEGWVLRPPRGPRASYVVRFTYAGRRFEIALGTRDRAGALEAAPAVYAHTIATYARPDPSAARVRHTGRAAADFEKAVDTWITALEATHDPRTAACYCDYYDYHWSYFFAGLHEITPLRCDAYMRARLGSVRAATVRKELSALRGFIAFAAGRGWLRACVVPSVPKRATGTAYPRPSRAAAIELAPREVEALIAALPAWSTSRRTPPFPIRARFVVAYETGLRPGLLDALEAPTHYRKGRREIVITPDLDKARLGRRVRISAAARKALDSVIPRGGGVIFGEHDYRDALWKAALATIKPRERAEAFCGAHLRSARITHWLDKGAAITAVQWQVGHKRLESTARYVRASKRAGDALIDAAE